MTLVGGVPQQSPYRPLTVALLPVALDANDPITKRGAVPDMAVQHQMPLAPDTPAAPRAPELPKTAVDLPVPFDSYISMDEVDVRAEPANDVPLVYPMAAYMQHMRGTVQIRLFISDQGRLDRVDLVGASPKGYFEKSALDAVLQLHFHPAIKNGRPVRSQKLIEVVFNPDPNPATAQSITPNSSAAER